MLQNSNEQQHKANEQKMHTFFDELHYFVFHCSSTGMADMRNRFDGLVGRISFALHLCDRIQQEMHCSRLLSESE